MDPGKWADESFQIVRADVYHFVDLETSSNSSAVEGKKNTYSQLTK